MVQSFSKVVTLCLKILQYIGNTVHMFYSDGVALCFNRIVNCDIVLKFNSKCCMLKFYREVVGFYYIAVMYF